MDPKLRRYFQEIGRKGGLARVRNQTPAERRKSAQKAVRARWAARKRSERVFWKGIGAKKRKRTRRTS